MMTGLNVARVAKLIALLGFALPWLLVSCAGEPIGRLTGIELATGGGLQSQHSQPNLWVTLSLAAVIAGIVASFAMKGRQALLAMATAAIVALVASAVGVSSVTPGAVSQPSQPSQHAGAGALGRVDLQYGYLITVAGLLAALGACGVTLARRDGSREGP